LKAERGYVADGYSLFDGRPRLWFQLPMRRYDLSTQEQLVTQARAYSLLFDRLPEGTHHLKVVATPLDLPQWEDEVKALKVPGDQGDLWDEFVELQAAYLFGSQIYSREAFLGVDVADDDSLLAGLKRRLVGSKLLNRSKRRAERLMGTSNPRPSRFEVRELEQSLRSALALYSELVPGIAPATSSQLRWLIARQSYLGQGQPDSVPYTRSLWGAELEVLADAELENGRGRVRLTRPEGATSYVAALPVIRMPEIMHFPAGGHEWLLAYDSLNFPVDVDCHIEVIGTKKAVKALSRTIQVARSQNEDAQASGDPDLSTARTIAGASEVQAQIQRDHAPLVRFHSRFLVAAPSEDELKIRVSSLRGLYANLGLETRPVWNRQKVLFEEAMPGAPLKQRTWGQLAPSITLGGSGFFADASLGDEAGGFAGWNYSLRPQPVFIDSVGAGRVRGTSVTAIVGQSGSGKSNTAYYIAYQAVRMGAAGLLVDPKDESNGLQFLVRQMGLPVNVVRFNSSKYPGVLDPHRLVDPERKDPHSLDTVRDLASNQVQQLVGHHLWEQGGAEEFYQAMSAAHEARQYHMVAVLEQIRGFIGQPDHPYARNMYVRLTEISRSAIAGIFFGDGRPLEELNLSKGLTVVRFDSLDMPQPGTPRSEWTTSQMLSSVLLQGVAQLSIGLLEAGGHAQPKAFFGDELWMLSDIPQGRTLISQLARLGSSKNVSVYLISQNPSDLQDERIRNQIGITICLRMGSEGSGRDAMHLLGLSEEHYELLTGLDENKDKGKGIMKDRQGRIGHFACDLMGDMVPTFLDAFDTTAGRQTNLAVEELPEVRATGANGNGNGAAEGIAEEVRFPGPTPLFGAERGPENQEPGS